MKVNKTQAIVAGTFTAALSFALAVTFLPKVNSVEVDAVAGLTANRVTDLSTLAVGDVIILTNTDGSLALSSTPKANNRPATAVTLSGSTQPSRMMIRSLPRLL